MAKKKTRGRPKGIPSSGTERATKVSSEQWVSWIKTANAAKDPPSKLMELSETTDANKLNMKLIGLSKSLGINLDKFKISGRKESKQKMRDELLELGLESVKEFVPF